MTFSTLKRLGLFAMIATVEAAQKFTRVVSDDEVPSAADEASLSKIQTGLVFGVFVAFAAIAFRYGCEYGALVAAQDQLNDQIEQFENRQRELERRNANPANALRP